MSINRRYTIDLDVFEGPLDLLLYFIKRDEINIYDIPIAKITREYLDYLNLMQTLNLRVAGEFVAMASTLMRIKAQMLLPRISESDDDGIEDPRNELVQRLLEYQQYKEVGQDLRKLESENLGFFPRKPDLSVIDNSADPKEILQKVTLFDILTAFKRVLDRVPDEISEHRVDSEEVSVADQTQFIYSHFIRSSRIQFSRLAKTMHSRVVVIVTFLALLDMIRTGQVRVYQEDIFEDFTIEKVE